MDARGRLNRQASFSDRSTNTNTTARSFNEQDFQLPDLEVRNAADFDVEKTLKRQMVRRKSIQFEMKQEKQLFAELDEIMKASDAEFSDRPGVVDRPTKLRIRRGEKEAEAELDLLHYTMKRRPGEWKDQIKVLEEIINGEYEGEDADEVAGISSVDHPKLNSVEEKKEDIRQEEIERWCKKHGVRPKQKYSNLEKRLLRKWFQALDYDGSGEVNVEELQDPMLSSGILKTREQVVRVLANVDRNNTMGIDFEEFLLALNGNKLADQHKLRKLQQMSADPHFNIDTLIGIERRKKLTTSILKRCEERQNEIDNLYKKYDKPKLTRREKELFHIERANLEEQHAKSIYLHMKYVGALDGVIEEKKRFNMAKTKEKELSFEERINQLSSMDMYRTITQIRFGTDQLGSKGTQNLRPSSRQDMMKKMEIAVATGNLMPVNVRSRGSAIALGLQMRNQSSDTRAAQSNSLLGQSSLASDVNSSMYSRTMAPFREAHRSVARGPNIVNSHYDLEDNHFKLYAPRSPEKSK